jgi:hypothetical protein
VTQAIDPMPSIGRMDDSTLILLVVGAFTLLAVGALGWAAWRLRRPGLPAVHPVVPAVMLVVSLALLALWAIRADWLGVISSGLLATSFALNLRTAVTRRRTG